MLRGCERDKVWCEPIEISLVYSLIPLVPADMSANCFRQQISFTYSSSLKSLKPTKPSSLAFHTP